MNSVNVHIPNADMPFFRKLSKKMGWTYSSTLDEKTQTLQSIEQSLRELKQALISKQRLITNLKGIDYDAFKQKAVNSKSSLSLFLCVYAKSNLFADSGRFGHFMRPQGV